MTDKEHLCDLHDDNDDLKETKWPRGVGRQPTKRRGKGRYGSRTSYFSGILGSICPHAPDLCCCRLRGCTGFKVKSPWHLTTHTFKMDIQGRPHFTSYVMVRHTATSPPSFCSYLPVCTACALPKQGVSSCNAMHIFCGVQNTCCSAPCACCLTQCVYCQGTVRDLRGSVCMLSICRTHVVLRRVHVVNVQNTCCSAPCARCQCSEHMLLCAVCMLSDAVCILSAYVVQVVRFTVHVVNVQNTCCSAPCACC
jgi:hypothetical protein